MFVFEALATERLHLKPTVDEEAYRLAMKRSHRELEPKIYPAALDFRFHPGKVLIDLSLKENGTFVGGFSLHDWHPDLASCELGYWILPDFQGQGLMQEAANALLEQLFAQGLKRISLICDVRNRRSITLARRLGFQHEAYLTGFDAATDLPVTKLIFARYP